MNRINLLTILFLLCSFLSTYSQDNSIEKARKLIEERKYETAYKLLNEADPDNQNPDFVMEKSDLLLHYFTKSIMHRLFGLKDLDPNEDLMELRSGQGNFSMVMFDPDSVLNNLIIKYPDNYQLRKSLGNYYHEIHLKYPNGWFEPDSIVVHKFKENYILSYEKGVYDYWTLYGIGYACLIEKDYKNSIPYFEKSIELKNDYPSSYYNLGYAYLFTDQQEKGIISTKKALDLYQSPDYKADAARMIGAMYTELKQNDKALEYYYQADIIQPHDYYTLRPILEIETLLIIENYKNRTKEFFLLAPGNPTIYQDLMKIYWDNKKQDELIMFLENQKSDFRKDNKVLGNIYFYMALIQYDKEDYTNSKLNFEKSREIFKKVYQPDHEVFDVINSYTDKMWKNHIAQQAESQILCFGAFLKCSRLMELELLHFQHKL
jgi:tetratricopeptide (TPR) repeat protein